MLYHANRAEDKVLSLKSCDIIFSTETNINTIITTLLFINTNLVRDVLFNRYLHDKYVLNLSNFNNGMKFQLRIDIYVTPGTSLFCSEQSFIKNRSAEVEYIEVWEVL